MFCGCLLSIWIINDRLQAVQYDFLLLWCSCVILATLELGLVGDSLLMFRQFMRKCSRWAHLQL